MNMEIAQQSADAPLWNEEEFEAEIKGMVAEDSPRFFAVVQELGVREDAQIAGWGLTFDDQTYVVTVSGGTVMSTRSPEHVVRRFQRGRVSARLVWVNP